MESFRELKLAEKKVINSYPIFWQIFYYSVLMVLGETRGVKKLLPKKTMI